eukprot:3124414-Amphidinium_carterae.1
MCGELGSDAPIRKMPRSKGFDVLLAGIHHQSLAQDNVTAVINALEQRTVLSFVKERVPWGEAGRACYKDQGAKTCMSSTEVHSYRRLAP